MALRREGVEIEEYFVESRTSLRLLWRDFCKLRRILQSKEFNIVHAQYGAANGLLSAFAALGTPLVLTLRGSDINRVTAVGIWRSRLTRLMSQVGAMRAKAVICVSDDMRERLWCNQSKVSVIPTGVDVNVFRPRDRAAARQSLGWEHDDYVIIFNAGQAPTQKGLSLVEASVSRLKSFNVVVKLYVTTGGNTREEMVDLFNASDCLVLASETEGSPNVVKEAMACNLPVVSVDVGDVRHRLCGVVPSQITSRDATMIAEALRDVLSKGQRSNGREVLLSQGLSQKKCVERICSTYKAIAGSNHLPNAER